MGGVASDVLRLERGAKDRGLVLNPQPRQVRGHTIERRFMDHAASYIMQLNVWKASGLAFTKCAKSEGTLLGASIQAGGERG